MRKYIYIALLLLFCSARASAQFTLVSGTVTDVNGVAYACGTMSASIVNQNGQSLYLNGVQFSPQPSATKLGCATDPSTSRTPGAFSVQLADNTQIKCGSGASIVTCAIQTQWLFVVNTAGIAPPAGTGPQACTVQASVSGSSQNISLSVCPALSAPAAGGGGAPGQFSVKTYGAIGDTKQSRNCTTATSSKIVTSTDNPWSPTDVGKFLEAISPTSNIDVFTPARKIVTFTSAGSITMDTAPDGGGAPGLGFCKWFTQDDTAAFVTAQTAAKAASSFRPRDQSPTLGYPGQVYCPSGGYTVSGTIFLDAVNASIPTLGIGLFGSQGGSHCVIYPTATFVGTVDPICSAVKEGLIYTCNTERTDIENIYVEGENLVLGTSSVAAGQGWIQIGNCTNCLIRNNTVTELGLSAGSSQAILYLSSFSGVAEYNFIQNAPATGSEAACRLVSLSSVLFSNNLCSNHAAQSLIMQNVGTRGSGSGQVMLVNQITDECAGLSGTVPCTQITNSTVNYVGGTSFGGVPEIMSIDGTSSVYMSQHNLQVFGSVSNNVPGVSIASGGLLEASESTLGSTGTSPIITAPAGATFVDVGGNNYINCLAGTCNKITATNFATNGFSVGIVPTAAIQMPTNTVYAVNGNLLATAQNLATIPLTVNQQLTSIRAQSGGTTPANSACATPPVITFSDGTRSATMTMTSGKTQWTSSVDAVTNLNQVFASGAVLTISIGANTCATPPSNVSVSYNVQSVINP